MPARGPVTKLTAIPSESPPLTMPLPSPRERLPGASSVADLHVHHRHSGMNRFTRPTARDRGRLRPGFRPELLHSNDALDPAYRARDLLDQGTRSASARVSGRASTSEHGTRASRSGSDARSFARRSAASSSSGNETARSPAAQGPLRPRSCQGGQAVDRRGRSGDHGLVRRVQVGGERLSHGGSRHKSSTCASGRPGPRPSPFPTGTASCIYSPRRPHRHDRVLEIERGSGDQGRVLSERMTGRRRQHREERGSACPERSRQAMLVTRTARLGDGRQPQGLLRTLEAGPAQ